MSIFGVKRGRVVDEDILSNATLNMDGKRIINVAYPRIQLKIQHIVGML